MPVEPLQPRRATCAEHGLAVGDAGGCVICRRPADDDEPRRGGATIWPSLFVLGCLAAGLIGWQMAGEGPERLTVRPHYRMAVVTMEAQVPVAELRREAERPSRPVLRRFSEPETSLGRPKGVHVTVTEAEAEAMRAEAPPPVFVSGRVRPPQPSSPSLEVQIAYASSGESPWRSVMAPTPTPRAGHRPASGRPGSEGDRPRLPWRPPPRYFPGGGTGELWKTGPSRPAYHARGTARPMRPRPVRRVRSASRPRSLTSRVSRPMASRAGSMIAGSRRASSGRRR